MCQTDSAANNCIYLYKTVVTGYVYNDTSDYITGTHNIAYKEYKSVVLRCNREMSATNSINNSYRKDVLSDKSISLSFVSKIQEKENSFRYTLTI
jgi:hypothetical protein